METADCFKCSLCVFLLEENEKLKTQLFETSVELSNYRNELLVDSGTQTDPISIHTVDVETANGNSVHGSCQTLLDIANDIDKLYDGSIIEDRAHVLHHSVPSVDQTNHETPVVESIDKSLQIPVNSTNGSICVEGATQQKTPQCSPTKPVQCSNSFVFDQNINAPYQSILGKPFSDFSASELEYVFQP